jgi:NADPH-dependent curcumin reductase CurA
MSDNVNRQVLLVEKPAGKLGPEHFKMSKATIPEPKDGEALLRVRYISLDAANRAWMHGATYRAAVEANTVMAWPGAASPKSCRRKHRASRRETSCSAIPAGRITLLSPQSS